MSPWRIAFLVGAAFLASKRGRELAKRAAQEVVKGSAVVTERVKEIAAKTQADVSDIVHEARAELAESRDRD